MPKPSEIELPTGDRFPILHEDRAVLAIDKPAGWMLVPFSWQRTSRNLQAAIVSSIAAGEFWARSRNLRFLRFIHRLDAETTGILLFGKSPGAVKTMGALFETRRMGKVYLAVVQQKPGQTEWICRLPLGPDPRQHGRICVDRKAGKSAETRFRLVGESKGSWLVEAKPLTGRTHQIRVHLAQSGSPIIGDTLYNTAASQGAELGLRAIRLAYLDPFRKVQVDIRAPVTEFLTRFGFESIDYTFDEAAKENRKT